FISFFFQAEDGIRDFHVTGVQTCALPISYPTSGYDLAQVLTQLGTGEAVVTVLSERGAPTPVAWTMLRAPQSLMGASEASLVERSEERRVGKEGSSRSSTRGSDPKDVVVD